jgi:arylsulfatase A-like enzyme
MGRLNREPAGFEGRELIWYAMAIGSLGGFLEASFRAARQFITELPAAGFFWELYWMAPLSAGIAALTLAGFLAVAAKAGSSRVDVTHATFLFGFLAIHGVLRSEGIPLDPLAELVLSVGAAAALARAAGSRSRALIPLVRRSPPYVLGAFGILVVLAALRLPSVAERRALADLPVADSGLPNVVLIILDTVRAANLGLYGYHRATTPELEEWAESGVVFDRAYATAPWTLPSHASIFTGRYPFEVQTGVTRPLDDAFPTLAEVLSNRGYVTAGFVANLLYTTPMSGLHRGFARYQAHRVSFAEVARSSWLSETLVRAARRVAGQPAPLPKDDRHVTKEFLDWLDRRDGRPFFAFLNYFGAHEPYAPPEPFRSRFGEGPEDPWGTSLIPWHGVDGSSTSQRLRDQWVDRYDGAISYVDHQLGLIRDGLSASGLLDNTVVVITADHGETWGEHGLLGHMNALYLPLLHVPLVVAFPRHVDPGTRIEEPVTLRDLPATILDLAGLDEGSLVPGSALLSSPARRAGSQQRSPNLAELETPPDVPSPHAPIQRGDMRALFDGSLHYIVNGDGIEELYDTEADPDEANDLSALPDFADAVEAFRATLRALPVTSRR